MENTRSVLRRLVKHHREGLFKPIAPYGSRPRSKEEVPIVESFADMITRSVLLKEVGTDVALEANEKIATPVGRLPSVSMVAVIETPERDETPELENGKVVMLDNGMGMEEDGKVMVPENGMVTVPDNGETMTVPENGETVTAENEETVMIENATMPSSKEEPSVTENRNNPHTRHSISYYLTPLLLLCFVFVVMGIMGVKVGGGIEWVCSATRQDVLCPSHYESSFKKTRMKTLHLSSSTLSSPHELSPWRRKEEWLLFLYYALRGLCLFWNTGIGDVYRLLRRHHDGGVSSPPIDEQDSVLCVSFNTPSCTALLQQTRHIRLLLLSSCPCRTPSGLPCGNASPRCSPCPRWCAARSTPQPLAARPRPGP